MEQRLKYQKNTEKKNLSTPRSVSNNNIHKKWKWNILRDVKAENVSPDSLYLGVCGRGEAPADRADLQERMPPRPYTCVCVSVRVWWVHTGRARVGLQL